MDFDGMQGDVLKSAQKVKASTTRRLIRWYIEALGCALFVGWVWWSFLR